jgi:hypothetical protein
LRWIEDTPGCRVRGVLDEGINANFHGQKIHFMRHRARSLWR